MRYLVGAGAFGRPVTYACIVFLGLGGGRGEAQSIEDAVRQQQQILRQQEEQRQEQLRQLRERAPASGTQTKPDEDVQADQNTTCFKVDRIEFLGAELLVERVKTQVKASFERTCITVVDILSIARAVTNWYVGQGYVTSRAFPPAQDLKSGTLKIQVVEGRVEDVDVLTNGELRTKPTNAFPHITGTRLNIRDVEQGLDQINRLPTHDSKISVLPGQKEGYSRIQVDDAASGMPITISTLDNFGSTATGLWQLGNTISIDDVFGLYDGWTFTHSTTAPFYDDRSSESYSASVTVPYGYWTFLLSASYFDYESRLVGNGVDNSSTGDTTNITAEIDRVLHRDQNSKTRLAGFVSVKDTHNFSNGIELEVLSRKLSVAGIRLSHNTRFWDGIADVSMTGETGVPAFGSVEDGDSAAKAAGAKAEFRKLSASLSYYKPFKLEDQVFAWQIRAKAQWSPDDLFSTEQLGVGGFYSVRGFRDESISGDSGAYMRNELSWTVPTFISSPEIIEYAGALKLFSALDTGWIYDDGSGEDSGTLTGVAAGLRLQGGMFFGEAAWERVLSAPEFLEEEGDIFRAQAGLQVRW